MPVRVHDRINSVMHRIKEAQLTEGRTIGLTDAAEELGFDPEGIEAAAKTRKILSLDMPIKDSAGGLGRTIGDLIVDGRISVEDQVSADDMHERACKLLSILSEKEAGILRLRFGFTEDERPWTLEEIGTKYNLTRERIRQIEARSLRKIRKSKHYLAGLT